MQQLCFFNGGYLKCILLLAPQSTKYIIFFQHVSTSRPFPRQRPLVPYIGSFQIRLNPPPTASIRLHPFISHEPSLTIFSTTTIQRLREYSRPKQPVQSAKAFDSCCNAAGYFWYLYQLLELLLEIGLAYILYILHIDVIIIVLI